MITIGLHRNRKGSYHSAISGLKKLNERHIPFSVICVLTYESLDYASEIFEWCLKNNIQYIAFNPEEIEGINITTSLSKNDSADRLKTFYSVFWDLVISSEQEIVVREFKNMASRILRVANRPDVGSQQNIAWDIVSVRYDGKFSSFSPELLTLKHENFSDFIFGDLSHQPIHEPSEKFEEIKSYIDEGVENCKNSCDYFKVCGGGSPSNKLLENGDFRSTKTLYCLYAYRALCDIVLEKLEDEVGVS